MPPGSRQIEMTWRCSSCSHQNLGRHTVCQQCGNPKDASEKYEMPGDTAAAPSVQEPELVQMATAGPNWRCAYCGSNQRKLDQSCAQCGAAPEQPRPKRPEPPKPPPVWWLRVRAWIVRHPFLTGAIGLATLGLSIYLWVNRTRNFDAEVLAVKWQQDIIVERYKIWDREGWRQDLAASAFEVQSLGDAIHHYEQVLDGYDTQHYTEQVACGEDCRDVPERCTESCSSNDNGFATCRTTCTGGGRSCTTRYCTESRTRQVPRYRQEPRYAEKVRYRIWDWGHHRTVPASGTSTADLRWPIEEARVGLALAEGEQERERREGHYFVTLGYDETERVEVEVGPEVFAGFAVGTSHQLTLQGSNVATDGVSVTRVGDDG
jgi:hypothetical protein